MITTLKTNENFIAAYIEWLIVNKNGQLENNGEYIYIKNCWIHEDYRHDDILYRLSKMIYEHPYAKNSKKVYWAISKYNGKKVLEENDIGEIKNSKIYVHDKEEILNHLKRSKDEIFKEMVSV